MDCTQSAVISLGILLALWLCLMHNRRWGIRLTFVVAIALIFFIFIWDNGHIERLTTTNEDQEYIDKLKSICSKCVDPKLKNIPVYSGRSSYTDDKKVIVVCLKDRDGNYFPINCLVYVLLHEYAHAVTPKEKDEHSPRWRANFDRFLLKAEELGYYDRNNPFPMEYMTECSE